MCLSDKLIYKQYLVKYDQFIQEEKNIVSRADGWTLLSDEDILKYVPDGYLLEDLKDGYVEVRIETFNNNLDYYMNSMLRKSYHNYFKKKSIAEKAIEQNLKELKKNYPDMMFVSFYTEHEYEARCILVPCIYYTGINIEMKKCNYIGFLRINNYTKILDERHPFHIVPVDVLKNHSKRIYLNLYTKDELDKKNKVLFS